MPKKLTMYATIYGEDEYVSWDLGRSLRWPVQLPVAEELVGMRMVSADASNVISSFVVPL